MIGLGIAQGRVRRGAPARDEESQLGAEEDKEVYASIAACLSKQRQRRRMTLAVLATVGVLGVGLFLSMRGSVAVEEAPARDVNILEKGAPLAGDRVISSSMCGENRRCDENGLGGRQAAAAHVVLQPNHTERALNIGRRRSHCKIRNAGRTGTTEGGRWLSLAFTPA